MKFKVAILAILLSGCAKHTDELTAAYVSPLQYQHYNCKQLAGEIETVSRRVSEVGGVVDKTASDDAVQMGVGLVLFFPTLFFMDANNPKEQEYSRLKGEFEALEKAAAQKRCFNV